MNNCEFIELTANIVTILGFVIGVGYVYKIYNKIEIINIQGKYITNINQNISQFDVSISDKDPSIVALARILKDIKYQDKNI